MSSVFDLKSKELLSHLDGFADSLKQALAVSKLEASALVLVSPLSGEPSIQEIDLGKFCLLVETTSCGLRR